MKSLSAVLMILLLARAACGADLAGLQQMALENREVVEKYQARLEMSGHDETVARSRYYPSFDVSYSTNWLDESTIFQDSNTSVAVGKFTWNLFAGFRDQYASRSADLLRRAESFKLQGVRQDIQLNVALRYLSIYNRQANLQVSEDSVATLQKLYEDGVQRFEVGLIKKSELLKFKVDLDHAEITRQKARAELNKSVLLLQREITVPVALEELGFAEFDQLPALEDSQASMADMLARRSEIKVLEEMAEAATLQVGVEKALYYPKVDLVGSYSRYYNDALDDSIYGDEDELTAGLVLSMNLFDGFGKSSRVGKARLEAGTIRNDLAEVRRDLITQLQNLFLDYEVSRANVAVADSSIAQAEENLRVTRLSYNEGLAVESELLDAITNLSRARFDYVAAKSEVYANYFQITRAVEGFIY